MDIVGGQATDLAQPVDLGRWWNADDDALAARLHPLYERGVRRLPAGPVVWRGLPLSLGERGSPRWLVVDGSNDVDLPSLTGATWLVVAHFCDSRRDAAGERPAGSPVGWVDGIGEELAAYRIIGREGEREVTIRRRFEVGDGITGWGYLPFAATGHRGNEPLDFLGPHPRLEPGRYAPAGHAGPLTTLPGGWGASQTGVTDVLPTPDDDLTVWLHAIPLAGVGDVVCLQLRPLAGPSPGRAVVVAGMTLFAGTANPLAPAPRVELLVTGAPDRLPDVDLGVAIRSRRPVRATGGAVGSPEPGRPIGWGPAHPAVEDDGTRIVDVTVSPDARMRFGGAVFRARDVGEGATIGGVTIRPLAPRTIRTQVRVTVDGAETPARVRFVAADGRYLPPVAHRDAVNPGLYEDTGADLALAGDVYAYVPGTFDIDLPPGPVDVEVVRGFDCVPLRRRVEVAPDGGGRPLELSLERALDPASEGWVASDSHVHFLAPSTALLQAAAEGVNVVHLLATQWADAFTNITDLAWGSMAAPGGAHHVVLGTENRENVLGHLALLGARRAVLPPASGGGPEGGLGGAVTSLLAEWAERCRGAGGLTIGAHFPLPYAEIASAIVEGLIDGVEMQTFAPGLDSPPILEWYRFLNTGHRLPILGGTDKMTSEVPVGAVRTYARAAPGADPTPDAWAAAVRAGRTFATSGPLISLEVEGAEPGEVISLPAGGGRLEVRASVRAAQPVISALDLVVNGRVVAVVEAPAGVTGLALAEPVAVDGGAWIAARSRSPHDLQSAFISSMASHTSPVYVEVPGRPLVSPDDAAAIATIIEGTAEWLDGLAAVRSPERRAAMRDRVLRSAEALRRGARPDPRPS